jgi:hypothetical protein
MKNTKLHLAALYGFSMLLPILAHASGGDSLYIEGRSSIINKGASIVITPAAVPDNTSRTYEPVKILYRVQILALKKPITLETVKVDGMEGEVYSLEGEGFTRYYMGEFHDLKSANEYREKLVKNGFEDACIVAYKNGDRITIKESLAILGEDK